MALYFRSDIGLKAQQFHPFNQQPVVFRVPFLPGFYTALLLQLSQSLCKGQHHMGWGCKAPLPVFLHFRPLAVQIQGQAPGFACTLFQCLPAGNDKRKPRDALNTFVGRADKKVDPHVFHRDFDAAKAGHGVYNQRLTGFLDYFRDCVNIIQNARGCFAMHNGCMGDIRRLF